MVGFTDHSIQNFSDIQNYKANTMEIPTTLQCFNNFRSKDPTIVVKLSTRAA